MTPEGITATAALFTAIGGAVAAIIAAIGAWKGNKSAAEAKTAAVETKALVQQVIAVQQATSIRVEVNNTMGAVAEPSNRVINLPREAIGAAIPEALPALAVPPVPPAEREPHA